MIREPAYFSKLFENMISMVTDPENFDRGQFVDLLSEICIYFGIAKGVTEFYRSPAHERIGDGERLVDFDNGRGERILHKRRIITRTSAIIQGTLYVSNDEPPLSAEDMRRVDLVLRALLSFISRNRLQRTVEQLAFHDEFGYRNIRFFMHNLWVLQERDQLNGYCAARYNLQHFSLVNRDVGRAAGDAIIRTHYQHIQELVGNSGVVCRMGGDNFIALFKTDVLDNVIDALKGIPITLPDNPAARVMIRATAGAYVLPDGYVLDTTDDIMDKVMSAAAEAKRGSESIVFYDDNMGCRKDEMLRIQSKFKDALEKQEFCAHYQPKVDIMTGEIIGAEALCRWHHDGSLVFPARFIPVLEQNSDICLLDMYMLDTVCRDIRRWLDEGRKAVKVSVNLSRKNLMDLDLLTHIKEVIDRHGVPHEYIEIELTETTTDVEFRDLNRVVCGLKDAGVQTSVDDFGNGYSSLNLIRTIPWNVVKIDRTLLPMDEDSMDSNTAKMFAHVVALARDIGIVCLSEGVETERQVKILSENKCHYAQGFFFEKAIPVEDFEKLLEGAPFEGKLKELGVIS